MRIAAMDLGSNSFHLLVADAHPDGTFEPLARDKEMLRLGSVVARNGEVGEEAGAAAVETIARFKALAVSLGADEIVACATSALREAGDSLAVVDRIEEETGVKVKVISGKDEARLVFDAVRTSVVIDPGPALAMDLGGGSLELMIGDSSGLSWSASLKLGVARLTAGLVRGDPPTSSDRRRVADAVTSRIHHPLLPSIADAGARVAVGSSGTLRTLIALCAYRQGGSLPSSVNQLKVSLDDLESLSKELLSMTSAERAELPGVEARRADLLPAGVLVATTVMKLAGLDTMIGCEWALREGMVLDSIQHHSRADWDPDPRAIRRESVKSLARRSGFNEVHARKVARIAGELFDGTVVLHGLGDQEKELLELAALLHDIGEHVSMDGHERHTAYLIENGRLRGFSPDEVAMLACMGRFHKRGTPKASFEPYARLSADQKQTINKLVALLQVADGLDRSHGGPVTDVSVKARPGVVEVTVDADDDIDLEIWGLRRKRELFERVFDCKLEVAER
ncbi:MAG TPA: Ppx/GppA phosphatase family protein [Acidimicrobiales bacterium]